MNKEPAAGVVGRAPDCENAGAAAPRAPCVGG